MTVYHFIIDVFNLVGVCILCFAALGILPGLVTNIIPAMFWRIDPHLAHGRYLKARMQLGRGIMLAMDFMVASDILETLLGTPGIWNIIKILCIVAVRSWLGYERYTEVHHMEKEYKTWEQSFAVLPDDDVSMHGSVNGSFSSLVREGSFSSLASFGNSGSARNLGGGLKRSDSFITKFRVNGADLATKIEKTFEDLDMNRDGFIDEPELRIGLERMGIIISEVKIKHMMGGQEKMSFDVFNTFIRRLALAESFAESIAEGHESGADDSFHSSHNSSENKKDK